MTETEMKWFRLGKLLRRNLMAGVKKAEWETLFEGIVTTTKPSSTALCATYIFDEDMPRATINDIVRITVDGVENEFPAFDVVVGDELHSWIGFGNIGIWDDSEVDTGYDFYLDWADEMHSGYLERDLWQFMSRTAGTYSIKIERKVL